jgi:hypothetical protein
MSGLKEPNAAPYVVYVNLRKDLAAAAREDLLQKINDKIASKLHSKHKKLHIIQHLDPSNPQNSAHHVPLYVNSPEDAQWVKEQVDAIVGANANTHISGERIIRTADSIQESSQHGRDTSAWAQANIGALSNNAMMFGMPSLNGQTWIDAWFDSLGVNYKNIAFATADTPIRTGHAALCTHPLTVVYAVGTTTPTIINYPAVATPGDTTARPNDAVNSVPHGTWVLSEGASAFPDGVQLYHLEVLDEDGNGNIPNYLLALQNFYTILKNNPKQKIVLSQSIEWFQTGDNAQIQTLITQIMNTGRCIIVAASGNDDLTTGPAYPAAFNGVIAVGGYETNYQAASFANSGGKVEAAAPAAGRSTSGLLSASNAGSPTALTGLSGTSMGTPNLAAKIAKLWAGFDLTGTQMVSMIQNQALTLSSESVRSLDWLPGMATSGDQFVIAARIFNLNPSDLYQFLSSSAGATYQAAMVSGGFAKLQALAYTYQVTQIPSSAQARGNSFLLMNETPQPLPIGGTSTYQITINNVESGAQLFIGGSSAARIAPQGLDVTLDYYAPGHGVIAANAAIAPIAINIESNGVYTVSITRTAAGTAKLNVYCNGKQVASKSCTLDQYNNAEIDDFKLSLSTYNLQITGYVAGSGNTLAPTMAAATNSPTKTVTPAPSSLPSTKATSVPTSPELTGAPSSHAPTSHAPSSHAPTSRAPTSHAPTSHAPTSHAPTSHAPTSHAPTSHAPTSHAPTSHAPTSHAPTSGTPTSGTPTTAAPTSGTPTTAASTSHAPTSGTPTTAASTSSTPTVPKTPRPTRKSKSPTTHAPSVIDTVSPSTATLTFSPSQAPSLAELRSYVPTGAPSYLGATSSLPPTTGTSSSSAADTAALAGATIAAAGVLAAAAAALLARRRSYQNSLAAKNESTLVTSAEVDPEAPKPKHGKPSKT